MSIIRSKVEQDYTQVLNSVTNDPEFSSKYLGTFLRLISKGYGWEISADGLATLYPTEKRDFYRAALKHMCKLGYLVRIPQPRVKGRYSKSVMDLYDKRQIKKPLSDKVVDKLFSNKGMTNEEIKKVYPQRLGQYGGAVLAKTTQQKIKTLLRKVRKKKNPPTPQGESGCDPSDLPDLPIEDSFEEKEPYGDGGFVWLTMTEYETLLKLPWGHKVDGLIDDLSRWIASKGAAYKSHFWTLKDWHERKERQKKEKLEGKGSKHQLKEEEDPWIPPC